MATENFVDALATWAKEEPAKRSRRDRHVIAFLAAKEDVKSALDAGYSMKTIWEFMTETGRIGTRYETFTLHVKRYIKHTQASRRPASKASSNNAKGFSYNPVADKNDLI